MTKLAKHIVLKNGIYTISTPHGEIKIDVAETNTAVRVWDNDEWVGFPQPEVIEMRGGKFLYFVLTDRQHTTGAKQ